MQEPEVDPRISHIWADAANFDIAYPVYQTAIASVPALEDIARAVELFEAIDEAISLGASSEYLSKLLALADEWNDMCLIIEVSPIAYGRGMAPEYVHAVYLLDYAYDDWKTLSERLAIMHDAGVPADYAAQATSRKLYVSDIAAAWKAGIAAEYVGAVVEA